MTYEPPAMKTSQHLFLVRLCFIRSNFDDAHLSIWAHSCNMDPVLFIQALFRITADHGIIDSGECVPVAVGIPDDKGCFRIPYGAAADV